MAKVVKNKRKMQMGGAIIAGPASLKDLSGTKLAKPKPKQDTTKTPSKETSPVKKGTISKEEFKKIPSYMKAKKGGMVKKSKSKK